MAETVTITDNRTGETIEVPITNGGVDASQWSKLLPGIWFYDPSFSTTAAASAWLLALRPGDRQPGAWSCSGGCRGQPCPA